MFNVLFRHQHYPFHSDYSFQVIVRYKRDDPKKNGSRSSRSRCRKFKTVKSMFEIVTSHSQVPLCQIMTTSICRALAVEGPDETKGHHRPSHVGQRSPWLQAVQGDSKTVGRE